MLRVLFVAVVRHVIQKVIELALSLFVWFGCKLEVGAGATFVNHSTTPSSRASAMHVRETSAHQSVTPSGADLQRAFAVVVFLGHRFPLLVTRKPCVASYYASVHVNAASSSSLLGRATQVIAESTRSRSNDSSVGEERSGCNIAVVLTVPWDDLPTEEAFAARLSDTTHMAVFLLPIPLQEWSDSAHQAALVLIHRIHGISDSCGGGSILLVASGLAATVALHVALALSVRNETQCRGLVLLDPFVGLRSPRERGMGTNQQPSANSFTTGFLEPHVLKKLAVGATDRHVSSQWRVLERYFPPPLPHDFSIPVFVLYDNDGCWVEEMQWYFETYSNCTRGIVEPVAYELLPRAVSSVGGILSSVVHPFTTSLHGWEWKNCDGALRNMELWVSSIGNLVLDLGTATPSFRSTTPWSTFSRRGHGHGDVASTAGDGVQSAMWSTDSMEAIFRGFKPTRSPAEKYRVIGDDATPPASTDDPELPQVDSCGALLDSLASHPDILKTLRTVASHSTVSESALEAPIAAVSRR